MERALTSLKLEDNNLETFSLVWFEISVNETKKNSDVHQQLRSSINYLKIFEDSNECENYIRSRSNIDRIILIVSDQSGEELVSRIHQLRQVSLIYVYCTCEKRDEQWIKKFTKVRNMIVQLDALATQIQSDQTRRGRNKIDEPLPISIFHTSACQDQSTTGLNGQFVYLQLLVDCLLRMNSSPMDKNELINVCKTYYGGNLSQLNILTEFERHYTPDKALWWYTRESFLCRLLNKALREQNIDFLFLFRFFIRDIRQQLEEYQCSSTIHIYRGQLMSNEELQVLKDSVGQFISTSSFLSTSISREVALFYLTDATPTSGLQKVLFDIDADPRLAENRPFANIASLSDFPLEEEVLIMLGSIFRLIDIRQEEGQVYVIRMTLCSDKDSDLPTVIEQIRTDDSIDNEETTNLLSFGNVLWTMGKYNDAEKYYRRLLNELPHDHECIAHCYYGLGKVADERGNYDLSLEWHQKSLEIKMLTLNPDDSHIADSHNRIGSVYYYKNDLQQALESYHKAFVIRKRIFGEDHLTTSSYFNNAGIVYEKEKKYMEALECHQKSLAILQKCCPANHPTFGISHDNIGDVYRNLGQYDLALEHYNRSLEIYRKTLPLHHPSIAETLHGISLVYEYRGELKQALSYLEEAAVINHHTILPTHRRAIATKTSIERISAQLQQYDRD